MKTNIPFRLLILSFALIFSVTNCSKSGITNPEEIGKEALAIIKSIPDINFEDYQSALMSHAQLQSLKPVNPEGFEKFLGKVTQEEIKKDYKNDFDKFNTLIDSNSGNWKNISQSEFDFELDSIDGFKLCTGRLKIAHGDDLITVKTSSIYNGKIYILAGMKPILK